MKEKEAIYRTYRFRVYLSDALQMLANGMMARVVKPIWNSAQPERAANHKEYTAKLDAAFCDFVQEHRRDMTAKEEEKIRRMVNKGHKWVGWYDQRHWIDPKKYPDYAGTHYTMRDQVLAKLDSGYKSFMRLRKNGHKDAFPPDAMGFCGWVRYEYKGSCRIADAPPEMRRHWPPLAKVVHLPGIGDVPFRYHRQIEGTIKTVELVVKRNRKWYVCFSCERTNFPGACRSVSKSKARKGKDLRQDQPTSGGPAPRKGGRDNLRLRRSETLQGGPAPRKGIIVIWLRPKDGVFLMDSEGRHVDVPGFYEQALEKGRRLNRIKSRRQPKPGQKASKNYIKAKRTLAKFHEHIADQRSNWTWNKVRPYAENYETIILLTSPAKPAIQYARDERAARSLCDGAYALFEQRLDQKCEEFGTIIIKKERPEWEKEERQLKAQSLMEETRRILWQWKRSQRKDSPAFMAFLVKACERLATLDAA